MAPRDEGTALLAAWRTTIDWSERAISASRLRTEGIGGQPAPRSRSSGPSPPGPGELDQPHHRIDVGAVFQERNDRDDAAEVSD